MVAQIVSAPDAYSRKSLDTRRRSLLVAVLTQRPSRSCPRFARSNGSANPYALVQGIQLWVTDGTAAGTTLIYSMPDFGFGQPNDTCSFKNFVIGGISLFISVGLDQAIRA